MKKTPVLLLALLLCLLLTVCAAATEAADLTEAATVRLANKTSKNLTDRKYTSYYESAKMANPALTVSCETPMHALYLCFQTQPAAYEIQVDRGSGWESWCEGNPDFCHAFYELPGVNKVRVYALGDKKQTMGFNEVAVFGEGTVPEWVQRWEKTPEKADILFVTAHPEEELLYLGGAIPLYACEKGRSVVLACFSYANTTRRSELLNGLWSMGYRYYPVIGSFKTAGASSAKKAYAAVNAKNGEKTVQDWLTDLICTYRPEVLVGPDEAGEGKNGQRMMLADACQKCVVQAENRADQPWTVKKLYLHLYGKEDSRTVFDWDQPMTRLGGRTGINLAYCAYLYHKSQDSTDKSVLGTGSKYDNRSFGLVSSRVGEDVLRNDFLENIPADCLTELPALTDLTAFRIEEILPPLNEKGFIDEGEYIYSDDVLGHYVYISPTLKVIITRKFDGSLPLTRFESEIWCDTEAGERVENLEYDPAKKAKVRVDAAKNALAHQTVLAFNGDYYTYRIGAKNGHPVGIEVRNGEVYYDAHYDEEEKTFFPNLDTLAFYEDGRADVHHSCEMSAKDYLKAGAYNVFSFGPYLIRDGGLSEWVLDYTKTTAKNPRHCFGMIEPGHYMDIMCEGRLGSRSEGVTMTQLAMLAQSAGCTECCNLDGGQTAVVVFMGKQLNKIGKYDGKTSARETCEILAVGTSEQVGHYTVK